MISKKIKKIKSFGAFLDAMKRENDVAKLEEIFSRLEPEIVSNLIETYFPHLINIWLDNSVHDIMNAVESKLEAKECSLDEEGNIHIILPTNEAVDVIYRD